MLEGGHREAVRLVPRRLLGNDGRDGVEEDHPVDEAGEAVRHVADHGTAHVAAQEPAAFVTQHVVDQGVEIARVEHQVVLVVVG